MAKNSHNYMRNKKNEQFDKYIGAQRTRKRDEDNRQKRLEVCGINRELIELGKEDRIKGFPPREFTDENDKKSYFWGYYDRGSILIEGKIYQKKLSDAEIWDYGFTDAINNIPVEKVKKLLENSIYCEGNKKGKIFLLGYEAYDYIIHNNMSLEEYIRVMSIVIPEILDEEFKKGYYTREEELKSHKNKSK